MYQVFCLKGTPPITAEEQDKCFHSKTSCWRLMAKKAAHAQEAQQEETPLASL